MTEPPEIVIPARDWGDDEAAPELPPLVLVSSRDGQGDPAGVNNRSAGWRSVVKTVTALGWTVRVTYALAWRADAYWLKGTLRKAAHHVHSVAVRMARGTERAVAIWSAETATPGVPASGWSFDFGMFSHDRKPLTTTQFKGALT